MSMYIKLQPVRTKKTRSEKSQSVFLFAKKSVFKGLPPAENDLSTARLLELPRQGVGALCACDAVRSKAKRSA